MSNPFQQIHSTPLTQVDTVSAKEALGAIRVEKNKWYRYVQVLNSGGTQALAAGDAVVYFAATGIISGRVVTRPAEGDAQPIAAGVLTAAIPGVSGTSYYCWIQTKGPVVLNQTVAGTPAVGTEVMAGATAGQLTSRAAFTTPKAGTMYNATTGVVLDCTGAL